MRAASTRFARITRRARPFEPPPGTPTVREGFGELFGRWNVVADDPEPFLSTGLRPRDWLERRLPEILAPRWRARRWTATISVTSTCGATTSAFARAAQCSSTGTGCRMRTPTSISRRGCRAWRSRAGRLPGRCCPAAARSPPSSPGVWAAVVGLPPPETAPTVRVAAARAARRRARLDRPRPLGLALSGGGRRTARARSRAGRSSPASSAALTSRASASASDVLILVEHRAERRDHAHSPRAAGCRRCSACPCRRCTDRRGRPPRP